MDQWSRVNFKRSGCHTLGVCHLEGDRHLVFEFMEMLMEKHVVSQNI